MGIGRSHPESENKKNYNLTKTNMKTKWIAVIVVAALLVGAAIYIGNTKLQKGSFSKAPKIAPESQLPISPVLYKKGDNVLFYINVYKSGNEFKNAYVKTWKLVNFKSGEAKCIGTTKTSYNTNTAVVEIYPYDIVQFEAFANEQKAEAKCKKPIYFSIGWKNFPQDDKLCKVWSAESSKKLEPCAHTLDLGIQQ